MLVKAKCVTPCWDSDNAVLYTPGSGPLLEGLFEIDRDGPLASLKLGSTYVFDFDRNCGPDDKPHDYSCKKEGCGKKFKTLAALGTHTNEEHREVRDDSEDLAPFAGVTCKICNKRCKSAYGLRLHNEKSHPFQSQPEIEAETTVPA